MFEAFILFCYIGTTEINFQNCPKAIQDHYGPHGTRDLCISRIKKMMPEARSYWSEYGDYQAEVKPSCANIGKKT